MTPEEHSRLIQRIDKIPQTDKAAVIITLDFADEIHINTFGKPNWTDFLINKLKKGGKQ